MILHEVVSTLPPQFKRREGVLLRPIPYFSTLFYKLVKILNFFIALKFAGWYNQSEM